MSKIKENLIGYDYKYSEIEEARRHVMVDELTEYMLMNMTMLEVKNTLRESIKNDYHTWSTEDLKRQHRGAIKNEQV